MIGQPTFYPSPWIYYSLACFAYILVGVFGAVVRWFHMCRPYASQGDYFYPARRHVTFFYFFVSLQLPYVFCPADPSAWFYVRCFGIVYYPICFAVLFFRYFRMCKIVHPGKRSGFIDRRDPYAPFFLLFLLLVAMFVVVVSGHGAVLTRYTTELEYVIATLSLLISLGFIRECLLLFRRIKWYNEQNFSNDADFPYVFAKRVLWLPATGSVIMWSVFLSDSREVYMASNIITVLFMLAFLCHILHPNKSQSQPRKASELERMDAACMEVMSRDMAAAGEDECDAETVADEGCGMAERPDNAADCPDNVDAREWETVKAEVLGIVGRRYLEPNLKRVEVIHDVVRSKRTLAGTFITRVGFYRLVNAFRVRHYEMLMQSPSAVMSQDMAAETCGFKNRWALSNARKRLTDFDYTIIEDFLGDISANA